MNVIKFFPLLLFIGLTGLACTSPAPLQEEPAGQTAVPTPIATPTLQTPAEPTAASPSPILTNTPSATSPSAGPTAVPNTEALLATVAAELPGNAFDSLAILPLSVPEGERPLWAVFSQGFRNYELEPIPEHFLAIFTTEKTGWVELARQTLNDSQGFGPDIMLNQGVTQVDLAPDYLWLIIEGGIGAHGGTFQLLRFDGQNLQIEVAGGGDNPGVGYLEDLNGDAAPELILRQHDFYVFCYACGVRNLSFAVYVWDPATNQMGLVSLQPLPSNWADHPANQVVNRAVELARAGLWADALGQIEEAERLTDESSRPDPLTWNAALIRLYNNAWQAELNHSPFPLLTHIFYGNYAAAVDLLRGYSSEQIFSQTPAIVQGTVAEGNAAWMAEYILRQTEGAIAARPDLAEPYYFRAWARSLINPADSQIALDLQQAATLAPGEPLFAQTVQPDYGRIQFAPGATSTLVTAEIQPQEQDLYVLGAREGQSMIVMLTTSEPYTRLTVQDSQGGYLNGQITPTLWQDYLPESGDYIIRVFGGDTAVEYTLQVIIPSRISFAPGATSAAVDGSLNAHQSVDYILAAQAGQRMDVTITSPNNNVLLTIVGADGIPLTNGLMSGASSWSGDLPATQDYTIRAIGTDEAADYSVEVTIE